MRRSKYFRRVIESPVYIGAGDKIPAGRRAHNRSFESSKPFQSRYLFHHIRARARARPKIRSLKDESIQRTMSPRVTVAEGAAAHSFHNATQRDDRLRVHRFSSSRPLIPLGVSCLFFRLSRSHPSGLSCSLPSPRGPAFPPFAA